MAFASLFTCFRPSVTETAETRGETGTTQVSSNQAKDPLGLDVSPNAALLAITSKVAAHSGPQSPGGTIPSTFFIPAGDDGSGGDASGQPVIAHSSGSDRASTSYLPADWNESDRDYDSLGACMSRMHDMEARVDAVLEGSIKSAHVLFGRYDMDLDQQLAKQDYYDLMLELNLALPYENYRRFISYSFAYADTDRDGLLAPSDFTHLYKLVSAARRAFRRQDHHANGQIDAYDYGQLLRELGVVAAGEVEARARAFVKRSFETADTCGRGTINFGQLLCWYAFWLYTEAPPLGVMVERWELREQELLMQGQATAAAKLQQRQEGGQQEQQEQQQGCERQLRPAGAGRQEEAQQQPQQQRPAAAAGLMRAAAGAEGGRLHRQQGRQQKAAAAGPGAQLGQAGNVKVDAGAVRGARAALPPQTPPAAHAGAQAARRSDSSGGTLQR